jgi:hypothetical protein
MGLLVEKVHIMVTFSAQEMDKEVSLILTTKVATSFRLLLLLRRPDESN